MKKILISIISVIICVGATKLIGECVGPFSSNMYVNNCVGELVLAVFVLIALVLCKRTNVLKFKTEGFKEGIATGAIILVLGACVLITVLIGEMSISASSFEIVFFVFYMLLVGFAEEVLFRGIVQNSVMEYIGTDSVAKVRIGIVISGVLFASIHMGNVLLPGVGYIDAFRQTISVIPIGILFGTVYFRSRNNIWPGVLLHAFNDGFTLLMTGYISNGSVSEAISETTSSIAGTIIIFTIIDLWILRKKKLVDAVSMR